MASRGWRLAGTLVLVLGLLTAAGVWWRAPADDAPAGAVQIIDGRAYPIDSRREDQQLERLGGKAAVLTYQFHQWFSSWWHGRRLGITLAVLSAVVGIGCLRIGALQSEIGDDSPPDPPSRDG